mmetsp:Transcript_52659/g.118626  ORF Transcript_52659/g.118626 Transcript_52659/m.118626 type:complete len:329 (+) Transcript_52659:67-1053(+)
MPVDPPLPAVPDDVDFNVGSFTGPQGLSLHTYRFGLRGVRYQGVIWLCHGYASHTIHEWFLPKSPGEQHNMWEGTLIDLLVRERYLVCTLDHQGHGRSEGARGLRCFFESFDELPDESLAYLSTVLLKDPDLAAVPLFVVAISMGGATAVRMVQKMPELFSGVAFLAPMLSLEEVKKELIGCCIRNGHLMPIADLLDWIIPTFPLAKPAKNTMHPLSQKEVDEDPLSYQGNVRVRVANAFRKVTDSFMSGSLRDVCTPFITIHASRDTFTDPSGSAKLLKLAKSEDKSYVKVGLGEELDLDMWHGLTSEPGFDKVFSCVVSWIRERSR